VRPLVLVEQRDQVVHIHRPARYLPGRTVPEAGAIQQDDTKPIRQRPLLWEGVEPPAERPMHESGRITSSELNTMDSHT
jgi:hypothetical protein